MKHAVLIVIVLILIFFGFFLAVEQSRESGQTATIVSDETIVNKGDRHENPEKNCLVFGAELSAQRLLGPADAGRADGAAE